MCVINFNLVVKHRHLIFSFIGFTWFLFLKIVLIKSCHLVSACTLLLAIFNSRDFTRYIPYTILVILRFNSYFSI